MPSGTFSATSVVGESVSVGTITVYSWRSTGRDENGSTTE